MQQYQIENITRDKRVMTACQEKVGNLMGLARTYHPAYPKRKKERKNKKKTLKRRQRKE